MLRLFVDGRLGMRRLARRPALAITAIAALSLGIGSSAMLFSVVRSVLWGPLPFKDADLLVDSGYIRPAVFQAIAARKSVFSAAALYSWDFETLTSPGPSRRLLVYGISPQFLPLLGVTPMLGRPFLPSEYVPGHDREVILSYQLWQSLGASPAPSGTLIVFGRKVYTVVGVMPKWFDYGDGSGMGLGTATTTSVTAWMPLALTAAQMEARGKPRYDINGNDSEMLTSMIGRLGPGTSVSEAQKGMLAIASALRADPTAIESYRDLSTDASRGTVLLLFGASGLLLLIACATVGGLILADSSSRDREMAVREALGATRLELLRLVLAQTFIIGVSGSVLGGALAFAGLHLFKVLAPPGEIPRLDQVTIGPWTLAFVVAAGIASVIVPAVLGSPKARGQRLSASLKEGAVSGLGAPSGGLRYRKSRILVAAQVASGMTLLVAGGLLIHTLLLRVGTDMGIDYQHVAYAPVDWASGTVISKVDDEEGSKALSTLLARLRTTPGISSVALTDDFPYTSRGLLSGGDKAGFGDALWQRVTAGYFRTLKIPVLAGRVFNEQKSTSVGETVVNETLAREYFPGKNPLGQTLRLGTPDVAAGPKSFQLVIVGVVPNVRPQRDGAPPQPEIYTSLFWPVPVAEASLLVRTKLSPSSLAAHLDGAIPPGSNLAVSYVKPIEQILHDEIWPQRFLATFVAIFAFLALALAALGVYGLLAWATQMRRHEIALRRALGAPDSRILRQILVQMLGVLLIGEAAGALGAAALTQMFRSWFDWFYWFSPADPLSYLAAGVALLIAGLVAAYVPLRHALGIGPAAALRCD